MESRFRFIESITCFRGCSDVRREIGDQPDSK
jgi:hypothetical protein